MTADSEILARVDIQLYVEFEPRFITSQFARGQRESILEFKGADFDLGQRAFGKDIIELPRLFQV